MHRRIRLLIVDDHPALRSGLVSLTKREKDIEIIAEAANGIEAVDLARSLKPDVILMDLSLPQKSGLEAIAEIHASDPEIHILVFSSSVDASQILSAVQTGASGYLNKESDPDELFTAVRNAFAGKSVINPQFGFSLLRQIQDRRSRVDDLDSLSEREMQILCTLALGLSDAEIARNANITEATVRSHISNIISKVAC